jgi:hypothetical protein
MLLFSAFGGGPPPHHRAMFLCDGCDLHSGQGEFHYPASNNPSVHLRRPLPKLLTLNDAQIFPLYKMLTAVAVRGGAGK